MHRALRRLRQALAFCRDEAGLLVAMALALGTLTFLIWSVIDYRILARERSIGEFLVERDDWGGWRTAVEGEVLEASDAMFGIGDDQHVFLRIGDGQSSIAFYVHADDIEPFPRGGEQVRVILTRCWYDGEHEMLLGRDIDVLD